MKDNGKTTMNDNRKKTIDQMAAKLVEYIITVYDHDDDEIVGRCLELASSFVMLTIDTDAPVGDQSDQLAQAITDVAHMALTGITEIAKGDLDQVNAIKLFED